MGTSVGGHGTGKRYPKARTSGQAGPSDVFPCLSLSCTHTQRDIKDTTKACSESNMRNTGTEMNSGDLYHGTDWLWSSFALNLVRWTNRWSTARGKGTALVVKGTAAAKSEKK